MKKESGELGSRTRKGLKDGRFAHEPKLNLTALSISSRTSKLTKKHSSNKRNLKNWSALRMRNIYTQNARLRKIYNGTLITNAMRTHEERWRKSRAANGTLENSAEKFPRKRIFLGRGLTKPPKFIRIKAAGPVLR